jgi:hypothetical protein
MDDTTKPSLAKSLVAQSKPRIGGRFVSTKEDSDESETPAKKTRKKKVAEEAITKDDLIYDTRLLTEEEKEYIGDDALRFYEIALKRARTPAEGHRYASVLVKYQHPSLSAIASKQEIEVTQKVLAWEWGGKDVEIEFDPTQSMEKDDDSSKEDSDSL